MTYYKQLPPIRELVSLAARVQFPASREYIQEVAQTYYFSEPMNNFLALFPEGEVFVSRGDFLVRSEEIEMYITHEKIVPNEVLHRQYVLLDK